MKLLLLVLLAIAPQSSESEAQRQQAKVTEVLAVQKAKCLGCHGPDSDQRKALRHYKNALDLAATVEEFVTPGDPEDSDLYYILLDGEMPPEDSDVEPLSKAEVEFYRQWIQAGAPIPPVSADADGKDHSTIKKRLLGLLARQHPALVHFPIGLLLSGALLEILIRFRRRESWLHAQRFCLRFGLLTALTAAGLGWMLAQTQTQSDELQLHRWLGVATTALALLTVIALPSRKEAPRRQFRFLLVLMAGVLGLTGHFGGYLVFGADYFRL